MRRLALLLLVLGIAGAQPWLPVSSQQLAPEPTQVSPPLSRSTTPSPPVKSAGGGISLPAATSVRSSSSSASSSASSSSSSNKAAGVPVQLRSSSTAKPPSVSSKVGRAPGPGISKPAAAPVATGSGSSSGRGKQATEQGSPSSSSNSSSSSSIGGDTSGSVDLCSKHAGQPGPWPLAAIEANAAGLPDKTDRVLICLISSGIIASSPFLSHNSLGGCNREDALDPGGCALPWASPKDNAGNWKKRGTLLAAIMAAAPGVDPAVAGVLPGKTELYVVPVSLEQGPGYGALDPAATATGGTSRLRAYSACEGRLRGLQSQDVGLIPPAPSRWRMVMLVDVAQPKTTAPLGSDYPLSEADWFRAATNTAEGAPGDILVVAPAGDEPAGPKVGYPAAIDSVLAVAATGCSGQQLRSYSDRGSKPDMAAPGVNIPLPAARDLSSEQLATAKEVEPWSSSPSSAAAAYVAGAAARLWNAHPDCAADDIRRALVEATQLAARAAAPSPLNLRKAAAYLKTFKCGPGSAGSRRRQRRRRL